MPELHTRQPCSTTSLAGAALALTLRSLSPSDLYEAMQVVKNTHSFTELTALPKVGEHLVSLLPKAEELLDMALRLGQTVVSYTDDAYPSSLRDLPIPPPLLFILGDTPSRIADAHSIAIVGARKASLHACTTTTRTARELAQSRITVVSGLALGIDGAAHRGALGSDLSLPTLAVLAHGLEITYPRSHTPLAERILSQGGLLISEYPPGTQPLKHHFLARNRIIAGLALSTVLVQAGERSGSLVTANHTLEIGREVAVLTLGETEPLAEGSSRLIGDGAAQVGTVQEIIETLPSGIRRVIKSEASPDLRDYSSSQGTPALLKGPVILSLADFLLKANISPATLIHLELSGKISLLPGKMVEVGDEFLSGLDLAQEE